MDYDTMVRAMLMMGFLPQRDISKGDQDLLQDMWAITNGEKNKGVSVDSLKLILLNTIGIRVAEREKDFSQENQKHQQEDNEEEQRQDTIDKLSTFDDDMNMFVKKGSHGKLFTHFKCFYVHRVQGQGQMKKPSRGFVDPDTRDSHKPLISNKNNQLAQKKREKL